MITNKLQFFPIYLTKYITTMRKSLTGQE